MRGAVRHAIAAALLGAIAPACGGAAQHEETVVTDPLQTVSAEELFERGLVLLQHDDFVRAEQYLVSAMQRGFDENRVMPPLLAACVRSSRLSAALEYAEPYLQRHPDAWSLRLLVATIQMGLGDNEEAYAQLRRVVEDNPDEATAHYMIAVLARDEMHDAAAAYASFQRYLELAPEGEHVLEARSAVARSRPPEGEAPQRADGAGEGGAGEGAEATGETAGAGEASVRPVRLPRESAGAGTGTGAGSASRGGRR